MFSCRKRRSITSCIALAGFALLAGIGGAYFSGYVTPSLAEQQSDNAQTSERDVLRLGIVPQQSASKLAALWGPVADHLEEQLGVEVAFMTTKNIPTFEACLRDGAFDIAYMNPYHYVIFSERAGYRALAHQAEKKLRGLMVVRKEADATSISDLEGGKIAFPSPGAFGASVVPRAEMLAKGMSFTPNYVRSHDSVYRAVAAGLVDGGGGVTRTFNATSEAIREQLRVVFRTDAYTPHAIATAAGVSDETRTALRGALLDLSEDAPDLLVSLGMTGFVAAMDEDWNDVRALGLKPEQAGLDRIEDISCPFD